MRVFAHARATQQSSDHTVNTLVRVDRRKHRMFEESRAAFYGVILSRSAGQDVGEGTL